MRPRGPGESGDGEEAAGRRGLAGHGVSAAPPASFLAEESAGGKRRCRILPFGRKERTFWGLTTSY